MVQNRNKIDEERGGVFICPSNSCLLTTPGTLPLPWDLLVNHTGLLPTENTHLQDQ